MRMLPFILVLMVGLSSSSCVARLPVAENAVAALETPPPVPPGMPVTEERVVRVAMRASPTEECFLRCGLAEGYETVEAEEGEGEFLHHEVAVFLGYTFERGEGGATVGLDYSYWFEEWVGVGAFVDYVAGELDAFAGGVGVWLRPSKRAEGLTFLVALGVDVSREEEESAEEHADSEGGGKTWEAKPLLRLGGMYAFDLGRGFRLLPTFYFDVIFPNKQAYVLGLTIGKEF